MQCPSCHGTIGFKNASQSGLDKVGVCDRCRGCWLDVATLEGTLSGVWTDLELMDVYVSETFSDYLCPHCRARMVNVHPRDHLELRIDRCPSCHGIWLDNGELKRLRNVLQEVAEEHAHLGERPQAWSALKWVAYRAAHMWKHPPGDGTV